MFILLLSYGHPCGKSLTHRKGIAYLHTCTNLPVQGHVFVSGTWYCMQSYAESLLGRSGPGAALHFPHRLYQDFRLR